MRKAGREEKKNQIFHFTFTVTTAFFLPETKENRKETPKAEINDKRATEPEETTVNDATDRSDAGTGVGGAAKDIVDGVGDAGKDIIDGVEDAGDALTGEDAKQNATGE